MYIEYNLAKVLERLLIGEEESSKVQSLEVL
jgi:hypothetical protein